LLFVFLGLLLFELCSILKSAIMLTKKVWFVSGASKEPGLSLVNSLIATTTLIFAFSALLSLNTNAQKTMDTAASQSPIFPKGERAPSDRFTGTVWVQVLVTENDQLYPTFS
jgi:hypothetical protein